jgi:hypothetical protein
MELVKGGKLRHRLADESVEGIEGVLIQSLLLVLDTVVRHQKIHTRLHCDNLLVRDDLKFLYFAPLDSMFSLTVAGLKWGFCPKWGK